MKNHIVKLFVAIAAIITISTLSKCSCNKTPGPTPSADSGTFLFHLHTQIIDSTIGGNIDASDSNETGPGATPWYLDGLGRRIELFVPQFFVTGIQLVNANGTTYNITNAVILKGLDSEDYYIGKAPIGTYVSANFTVGLANADSTVPPATLFITDGVPYPFESSMWNGTDYYGMKITGAYDTSIGATGLNPLPFTFNIPNSLTVPHQVMLPARNGTTYPYYILTTAVPQYVHVLCDYGQLLTAINLKTSNQASVNPLIADSLANNLTNMFRYEQ